MGQQPRPLRPELSPIHLLGAHLCTLREDRGLSQAQLGALVFCSADLIRRVETATRHPHASLMARCDEVLHSDGRLSATLAAAAGSSPVSSQASPPLVVASMPALRRALDSSDCPPDGPTRGSAELSAAVAELVDLRVRSRYDELASRIPVLLPELHRAHLLHGSNSTAGLLIQVYRAADAIADKYNAPDLAARIIDAMRHYAGQSTDPIDIAVVAYVRAEVFLVSGDFGTGRRMLEHAIAHHRSRSGPTHLAAVGALHMRCAILAARDHDPADVSHHLDAAERHADSVTDGVYRGTAFGPSSVRIHRLTAALDSDDHLAGVRVGAGWVPGLQVPAERRSHFHIDLARAHLGLRTARRQRQLSLPRARRRAAAHAPIRRSPHHRVQASRPSSAPRPGSSQPGKTCGYDAGDLSVKAAQGQVAR